MARYQGLWIQRIALTGGVAKAIYPQIACRSLSIGNASAATLMRVYTDPNDDNTYFTVQAGYSSPEFNMFGTSFDPGAIACYLYAAADMTAVVIWRG